MFYDIKNSKQEYNALAKFFHWCMALLIAGLVIVGFAMTEMAYSPEKLEIYSWHKSIGLLILWLFGARLLWRFIKAPPPALETHAKWEKIFAHSAHIFLYVVMIGMPLSGWLMSSAGEYPVSFFGIPMPALSDKNSALFDLMKLTHEFLAYGLVAVLGLHIAGAFKHHLIDRDETLMRMTGHRRQSFVAVLLLLMSGAFFLTVAYLVLPQWLDKNQKVITDVSKAEVSTKAQVKAKTSAAQAWDLISKESNITFQASVYGTKFTGYFDQFDADIIFNPDNLMSSKARVVIDIGSAKTGDSNRDEQMQGADWFNTGSFPNAVFETIEFQHIQANQYITVGHLTIRDITLPVSLPFTLEMEEHSKESYKAIVKGGLEINRLDFQLGQGQWADSKTVDETVFVDISIVAEQKKNRPD